MNKKPIKLIPENGKDFTPLPIEFVFPFKINEWFPEKDME